jgi:recombination protein RecR
VVETFRQVYTIEQTHGFKGRYHVLGGRLAPLDGVDIDDLNVDSLYARLQDGTVNEIILATSPDVEGEATAGYLHEELSQRCDAEISRLAQGIPVGADLTYADTASLTMALQSRRRFHD